MRGRRPWRKMVGKISKKLFALPETPYVLGTCPRHGFCKKRALPHPRWGQLHGTPVIYQRGVCAFGLSGCRLKPPAASGPPGFTRQPENSKRAHLSAPALQTPPKIPREDPQRGKKRTNFVAGRGEKKTRNFGPSPFGAPTPSGPHPSGPHPSGPHPSGPPFGPPLFLGLGPHPSAPHPSGPTLRAPHPSGPHPSGPHPSGRHPSGPHWVWPLACIRKTKQLKITKKTFFFLKKTINKKSKQF